MSMTQVVPIRAGELIAPGPQEAARLAVAQKCTELITGLPVLKPITSEEQNTSLAETVKTVGVARTEFKQLWEPYKAELHAAHKVASTKFNELDGPLEQFERNAGRLRISWEDQQAEAIRREEQRLQALVNADAQQNSSAIAQEQVLQAALEAEASGNPELAEKILAEPIIETPIMVPAISLQAPPKTDGLGRRTAWKGRQIGSTEAEREKNFELTVLAVAADLARPKGERRGIIMLLELNATALNGMAKAMKSQLNVPGCEGYPDTVPTKRS